MAAAVQAVKARKTTKRFYFADKSGWAVNTVDDGLSYHPTLYAPEVEGEGSLFGVWLGDSSFEFFRMDADMDDNNDHIIASWEVPAGDLSFDDFKAAIAGLVPRCFDPIPDVVSWIAYRAFVEVA